MLVVVIMMLMMLKLLLVTVLMKTNLHCTQLQLTAIHISWLKYVFDSPGSPTDLKIGVVSL